MKEKKVIVIGAGIIGLCSAYYLHKEGHDVTIIDAGDGTDNCSFGNAGYFCPSHIIPLASPGIISQGLKWMLNSQSPFYIKPRLNKDLISWALQFNRSATKTAVAQAAPLLHELSMTSKSLVEDILFRENINAGYKKSGLLMLCKTPKELNHEIETAKLARSLGQDAQAISITEAEKLNPGLNLDIEGAVYFKNDACFTPQLFMKSFNKKLQSKGVKIILNKKVSHFGLHGETINYVSVDQEQFEADEFVVAAGSWTQELLKQLKLNIPMQGGKGYSFMISNAPVQPQTPAILTEGRVAMTPMVDGLRFAGTMEINGLNHDIKSDRILGIKKTIMDFFPQFNEINFSEIKPWAGLRPCSPDGLPYVGKTNKYNNLTVAAGHAMLGITLGPITGKLVSEIISQKSPSIGIAKLAVDRYNRN
jgi:D-amino-acid dehydrogenase